MEEVRLAKGLTNLLSSQVISSLSYEVTEVENSVDLDVHTCWFSSLSKELFELVIRQFVIWIWLRAV